MSASVLAETCPQTVQSLGRQTLGALSMSRVAAVLTVVSRRPVHLPPHATMVLPRQAQQETRLLVWQGGSVVCCTPPTLTVTNPAKTTAFGTYRRSRYLKPWRKPSDDNDRTFALAPLVAAVCWRPSIVYSARCCLVELADIVRGPRIDFVASIATRIVQMVLETKMPNGTGR
jgi:hypothetical protein